MKRLVIITGGSRGIGEAIAEEFNDVFHTNTHLLLLARDFQKLADVRTKLLNKNKNKNQVSILNLDFSLPHQVSDYAKLLKEVFVETNLSNFNELYVIFNHGTLEYGSISLKAQEPLRENFETNLFSVWSLLSAINLLIPTSLIGKQFFVNISSKYAEEPVAQWSGQCCGKFYVVFMLNKAIASISIDILQSLYCKSSLYVE
jgi:short-subunit dehydrogenase